MSDKRIGRLTLKSMIHISVVCVQYCLKIELKLFDTGRLCNSTEIEVVVYSFSFFPYEIGFMHVLSLFYFSRLLFVLYCVIQISAIFAGPLLNEQFATL